MSTTVFILLALFGIKHFIADYAMQFDYMLREKGIYGAEGGIHHAMTHASWTLLVLVFFCQNANDVIVLALADGFIHYHIDWCKQKLNRGLTSADRMFWVWMGADQGLHYLTYIGIIAYVTIS
jgi:hypothetical protein